MTETAPPTTALPVAEAVAGPQAHDDDVYPSAPTTTAPPRRTTEQGHGRSGVASDVKPEKPTRHPIAYTALALSIISLLWLAVLSSSSGSDVQKVRVGNQDCVSVPQDNGPAALYCRTAGLPRSS